MQIYQTKLLKKFPELTSYFTDRGDSNLAFHVGEDQKSVLEHHIHLSQKLHYDYKKLVHMKQIHSNRVKIVESSDDFFHPPTCDALITDKKSTPLMVMVADCAPLLFYDKRKKVIAVAHAGRAGAFKNIVQTLINCFVEDFHSQMEDIYVSIGANIKSCCYEVGDEIFLESKTLNLEYSLSMKSDKYFLDIDAILKSQLLKAGIKEQHIEFSQECSSCIKKKYFSYRRDGQTGRFAGVIFMR